MTKKRARRFRRNASSRKSITVYNEFWINWDDPVPVYFRSGSNYIEFGQQENVTLNLYGAHIDYRISMAATYLFTSTGEPSMLSEEDDAIRVSNTTGNSDGISLYSGLYMFDGDDYIESTIGTSESKKDAGYSTSAIQINGAMNGYLDTGDGDDRIIARNYLTPNFDPDYFGMPSGLSMASGRGISMGAGNDSIDAIVGGMTMYESIIDMGEGDDRLFGYLVPMANGSRCKQYNEDDECTDYIVNYIQQSGLIDGGSGIDTMYLPMGEYRLKRKPSSQYRITKEGVEGLGDERIVLRGFEFIGNAVSEEAINIAAGTLSVLENGDIYLSI